MILSSLDRTDAFTSGTTNFLLGSILQADELSITVTPASANLGANFEEVSPPAENKAIAGFNAIASSIPTTLYFLPLDLICFPLLLSEATGINSVIGRFLSSNPLTISEPTSPVAPIPATFILL